MAAGGTFGRPARVPPRQLSRCKPSTSRGEGVAGRAGTGLPPAYRSKEERKTTDDTTSGETPAMDAASDDGGAS